MRNELFEYAISTLPYKKPEKTNQSLLFYNTASTICMYLVMIVFSIPMIISKPYLWIVFLAIWGLMLLFRRIERNAYMKAILIDGMLWIYLAIFLSYILINFSSAETKNFSKTILIILTGIYLLAYEIVFLIKISKKEYSKMKKSGVSKDNEKNSPLITTLSFIGAGLGITLSRTVQISIFSIFKIMLAAIIGALWLGGFILMQKYIILKIQRHK